MLPSSTSSDLSMLEAICPPWSCQTPAVLPRSCMRHLTSKLPKLHRGLHQAATPGKAMQRQICKTQGKHTYLVQQFCPWRPFLGSTTPALLQARVLSRMAQTSASWLRTCNRSGTMRPTPIWAASASRPRATRRSGGAAARARLGSRTDGNRASTIAPAARAAPTMLAEQCAPATTWLTTTLRWQPSGTGRPTGEGPQRL